MKDVINTWFKAQWDDNHVLINTWERSLSDLETRLHAAGYRLDPYPNGKSKDELIKRIEELEAEKAKLSLALYGLAGRKYGDGEPCFCDMRIGNPMVHSHSDQCERARKTLAETSTVKS